MKRIKNKLLYFGIDGAVFFTVMARLLQGLGGVFAVVLVAHFLSKSEQGYYYTFSSMLAIQIFFELGLSGIITQFVAHEMAHLSFDKNGISIIGNDKNLSRLSSLLKFSFKWFLLMAALLLMILCIAGFYFFSNFGLQDKNINWQTPWVIVSVGTAFSLIITPIFSFLEGIGKIKDVAKMRFLQISIQLLLLTLGLVFGLKLFAYPIANIVSIIILPFLIVFSPKIEILKHVWKVASTYKINYKKEIFPLQWKISLSWISGYFIYQIFNPVIFAYEGPVAAGKMGITLAIVNGISLVSLSWINTKIPVFSSLIAKKEYTTLDQLFNKTLFQSTMISILGYLVLLIGYFGLKYFEIDYYKRFLPFGIFTILFLGYFLNQAISALAIYLRCHKKEPMLVYSIISAILIGSSTLLLGKYYGVEGIVYGFTGIILAVCFPWCIYIFLSCKKKWHQ